jgi:protein Mpv17
MQRQHHRTLWNPVMDNDYASTLAMSSLIVDECDSSTNSISIATATTNVPASSQSSAPQHPWLNASILLTTGIAVVAYLVSFNAGIWHGWTVPEIVNRIPVDLWQQYTMSVTDHPIATKACTSATVYTIGDIIAQRTAGATSMAELDRLRVTRSMIAGLIGHGPMSHFWYNFCDGFFADTLHITAWWAFIPKVIVDQTFWGPFWNNSYILLLGLMKMERLDTIWEDVKKSTIPLVISGLKLWPLAHLVTYGLIPVENRLLWVDMVEIVWVTVLATQAASLGASTPVAPNKGNVDTELKSSASIN